MAGPRPFVIDKSIYSMSQRKEERKDTKRPLGRLFWISAKNSRFEWNFAVEFDTLKGFADSERIQRCNHSISPGLQPAASWKGRSNYFGI